MNACAFYSGLRKSNVFFFLKDIFFLKFYLNATGRTVHALDENIFYSVTSIDLRKRIEQKV